MGGLLTLDDDDDSGVDILDAEGARLGTMCDVMKIRIEGRDLQLYVDEQSSAERVLHGYEHLQ